MCLDELIEPLDPRGETALADTEYVAGYPYINEEVILKKQTATQSTFGFSAAKQTTRDSMGVYDWDLMDNFNPVATHLEHVHTIVPK